MNTPLTRIAYVTKDRHALVRRQVSGVCRYAMPKNGFITREFFLDGSVITMPDNIKEWGPAAVICFLAYDDESLLESLGGEGRPVINLSRCEPLSNRAVILGEAEELYNVVHQHFSSLGINYVTQVTTVSGIAKFTARHLYQAYAATHNLECHSFDVSFDPPKVEDIKQVKEVEPQLAEWLRGLPKPAGVFTQQTRVGPFLCHCCRLLGIRVPEDIAIIGGDGFDVANSCEPPLTAYYLPAEDIGYKAAELIAAMIKGQPAPQEIIRVPGLQLMVRESTGGVLNQGCNIDAALHFIHNHACEGITVNDVVSDTQSISRMTFNKRFVEATGMTPATAILNQKMSEARRLLSETNLSIGTIAGMCGYQDDLYFSQVFRKVEGVPPRDYRRLQLSAGAPDPES